MKQATPPPSSPPPSNRCAEKQGDDNIPSKDIDLTDESAYCYCYRNTCLRYTLARTNCAEDMIIMGNRLDLVLIVID